MLFNPQLRITLNLLRPAHSRGYYKVSIHFCTSTLYLGVQDCGVAVQDTCGVGKVLVKARHESEDAPHHPGHFRLRDRNAEKEPAMPWGSGHCVHGHDALFATLLQATHATPQ